LKRAAIYGKPYEYPALSTQVSRKHRADDMAAQNEKSFEVTSQRENKIVGKNGGSLIADFTIR
jgi:hypothetical protein